MTKNILIVNHDIYEANSIKLRLDSPTTTVICAHTIGDALSSFGKMEFCLVILDADMSASDDHNLLKAMRNSHTMPILVLSSHADSAEKIHAFNAGAHAYMGKPYTDEECLAQAHALMQLYVNMHPENKLCYTLAFGNDLVIDPTMRKVHLRGKELKMTRKEFDLLFWLASNPGKVFSRDQLYDRVWDDNSSYNVDDIVKAHIKTLRSKLSTSEIEYIQNVWGVGYQFQAITSNV